MTIAIVTTHYRPKPAPRKKRKQSEIASRIVTPPKLKPIKGPVIRLGAQVPKRTEFPPAEPQPKRSAIVEPKRKRTTMFGSVPDYGAEEHQRRGNVRQSIGISAGGKWLWCVTIDVATSHA